MHIVNQPYIFKVLFAMFKPFLREKLTSRIHFHGSDKQSLMKHVDSESVMKRFGGSLPDDGVPGEVMWGMLHHYEEGFKSKLITYIKRQRSSCLETNLLTLGSVPVLELTSSRTGTMYSVHSSAKKKVWIYMRTRI